MLGQESRTPVQRSIAASDTGFGGGRRHSPTTSDGVALPLQSQQPVSRRGYVIPETKTLGEKQFIGERGIRHRVLGVAELIDLLVGITNKNLRAALLPDDGKGDRVGVLSLIKEDRVVIKPGR